MSVCVLKLSFIYLYATNSKLVIQDNKIRHDLNFNRSGFLLLIWTDGTQLASKVFRNLHHDVIL